VLVAGYNYPRDWWLREFVFEIYPNSGADLIGVSIVLLVIDRFAQQRADQERREQLVRECGSGDHGVANRALLELETRRWLTDGTLADAQLAGANLTRARLAAADLSRANLVGAILESADLSRAVLSGARLGGANLSNAVLEWAVLTGAVMSGANLHRIDAAGATLTHADLTHTNLTGADLTRVDLRGADLSGADLSGANLTAANVDTTIFREIRHDLSTRWPSGFRLVQDARRAPRGDAESGRR
jgi:uncharacterized protein YjbI with pentapeptide repeats